VKAELEPSSEADVSNGANGGGLKADIDVRTKFPVARIKRIMQSDEDVGKVAQVTPVVVCKCYCYLSILSGMSVLTTGISEGT
jgi:hypothetical protein